MNSTRILYLNNDGSRWRVIEDGKNIRMTWKNKAGRSVTRAVNYCQQWGNHAACNISWKGNRINVFPDSILK